MSEEISEMKPEEDKQICFIFQDETKIFIPLSFLQDYPNSLLSVICNDSSNLTEGGDAYYVDYDPMSLQQFINVQFSKEKSKLEFSEIFRMYKAFEFYFERYEKSKLYFRAMVYTLINFMFWYNFEIHSACLYDIETPHELVIHDVFTEERIEQFIYFSDLFDYFNVTKVTIQFLFDDRIPYNQIYPSNLHKIFPRLETYIVNPCYYAETKYEIQSEYDIRRYLYAAYKEMKERREHMYNYLLDAKDHPDKDTDYYINDQTLILSSKEYKKFILIGNKINDFLYYHCKERAVMTCAGYITYDDFYVQLKCKYNRDYNMQQIELKNNDHKDKKNYRSTYMFIFNYIDHDGCKDIDHPILKHSYDECIEILIYMLNLPICRQIKKIHTSDYYQIESKNNPKHVTYPFLTALDKGVFDSLQIFNIFNFIESENSEEIQLFVHIISTHIFPNVTTLEFDKYFMNELLLDHLDQIIPYITRTNFPHLHIYDLRSFLIKNDSQQIDKYFPILFSSNIIELMDTVLLSSEFFCLYYYYLSISSHITSLDKFVIDSNLSTSDQHRIPIWKQLCKSNEYKQKNYSLCLKYVNFELLDYCCDLKTYPVNNLYLKPYLSSTEKIDHLNVIFKALNCQYLQNVCLNLTNENMDYNEYYIDELFSVLCSIHYDTVQSLEIYEDLNTPKIGETIDINKNNHANKMAQFLSLFKNLKSLALSLTYSNFSVTELFNLCEEYSIWNSIQDLTITCYTLQKDKKDNEVLDCISSYLLKNKLPNLRSLNLELSCIYNNNNNNIYNNNNNNKIYDICFNLYFFSYA
ncbi:hypothetical protein WA158_007081 [Blastocystis sp. Blastoise]